jgi:hypothetical protein
MIGANMTPAECLRCLQTIRYSPRAGRPVGISWIARQAGVHKVSLFRAIFRAHITPDMAKRLSPILARVFPATQERGNIAPTLGQLGAGLAGHGRLPPRVRAPAAPSRKAKVETRDG